MLEPLESGGDSDPDYSSTPVVTAPRTRRALRWLLALVLVVPLAGCGTAQPTVPTVQALVATVGPQVDALRTEVVATVQAQVSAVAPTLAAAGDAVATAAAATKTALAPTVDAAASAAAATRTALAPTVEAASSAADATRTVVAPTVEAAVSAGVATVQAERSEVAATVEAVASEVAPTLTAAAAQIQPTIAALQTQAAPTIAARQTEVAPAVQAIATAIVARNAPAIATSVAESPVEIAAVNVDAEDTTVQIRNRGTEATDIKGWILAIGTFPFILPVDKTMELDPAEAITLHFSRGDDTNSDIYLGQAPQPLLNSMQPGTYLVLINLRGDVASYYQLP